MKNISSPSRSHMYIFIISKTCTKFENNPLKTMIGVKCAMSIPYNYKKKREKRIRGGTQIIKLKSRYSVKNNFIFIFSSCSYLHIFILLIMYVHSLKNNPLKVVGGVDHANLSIPGKTTTFERPYFCQNLFYFHQKVKCTSSLSPKYV